MDRPPSARREAPREVLVFVLGREEYGVDILKVQEIRGYEKVTPIPASPDYLKGVVVLRVAGRVIGVVVDGVSDVVQLAPADVKPAPQLGAVVDSSFLAGVATLGGRMILLLDIERFLSSAELNLLA